jgi:hypothetical protein
MKIPTIVATIPRQMKKDLIGDVFLFLAKRKQIWSTKKLIVVVQELTSMAKSIRSDIFWRTQLILNYVYREKVFDKVVWTSSMNMSDYEKSDVNRTIFTIINIDFADVVVAPLHKLLLQQQVNTAWLPIVFKEQSLPIQTPSSA